MTKDDSEDTMIPIKKGTARRLKKIGTMEDTYDSVVNRLIDSYENKK